MKLTCGAWLGTLGLVTVTLSSGAWAQSAPGGWSGPYVGGFGGYGSGVSSQSDNGFVYKKKKPSSENGPPRVNADGRYGVHGALGGALVGFNYQYSQFLVGVEGDIAGTSIGGSSATCGAPLHTCGTSIRATADVRGRIGIPYGKFLPFIAGGAAFARINAFDSLFGQSGGSWRTGYSIGAGVEYKLAPQVGLRLEYVRQGFGSFRAFDIVPGVPERVKADANIIRAGISFYFTPPEAVIARY